MRAISSPFYRQFLAELPIRSILHREIVLTMKASFTLRAYLMPKDTRKSAMKNKRLAEQAAL